MAWIIVYIVIMLVILAIVIKMLHMSLRMVELISDPLQHIIRDNQTYCILSLIMIRIIQFILLIDVFYIIFIVVMLLLPSKEF